MAKFIELARSALRFLPDRYYLSIQYIYRKKRFLRLKKPKCFNEKIQWIKLNFRDPLCVKCADKFLVREYVESLLGKDVLIPMLGVYESVGEIPYDSFPNQFVLKATHGSGWNVLCYDKAEFDPGRANQLLAWFLAKSYYQVSREWVYRDIQPRIIAEVFLQGANGEAPPDYKFFCFHGEPKYIQVDLDRFSVHRRNFYDCEWNRQPFDLHYPSCDQKVEPPPRLGEMVKIARKLSANLPFVRVDLYNVDGKIYFGEMTFYPGNGFEEFKPEKFDRILGDELDLSLVKT